MAAGATGPILEIGCGGGRILTALGVDDRQIIGVDLDPFALALATERAPSARWISADGRLWRDETIGAGLVMLAGDLLSIVTEESDLAALMRTAARHCALGGQVGIDATLMDPQRFGNDVEGEWSIDLERADDDLGTVRRESRFAPNPQMGKNSVLLEIRHRVVDADGRLAMIYPDRPPFAIRAWQPDEVRTIAGSAGLRVARVERDDRLRWLLRSVDE